MSNHKFKVGQTVNYTPRFIGTIRADAIFKITRLLPAEDDRFPRRAAWLEEFTAELLAFPGRHDAMKSTPSPRASHGVVSDAVDYPSTPLSGCTDQSIRTITLPEGIDAEQRRADAAAAAG
jgi:hypothetical protein